MDRARGIEPPTSAFVARCSCPLSYARLILEPKLRVELSPLPYQGSMLPLPLHGLRCIILNLEILIQHHFGYPGFHIFRLA